VVFLATVVNLATGIRYQARAEATLSFVPFPGLVLRLQGGMRIPFTHKTRVEYGGEPRRFLVTLAPKSVSDEKGEELQIRGLMNAGFRVWWPYDRTEHLRRKLKPQLKIIR